MPPRAGGPHSAGDEEAGHAGPPLLAAREPVKLEEVGGDVVAFGAGVVGFDDVVGWDVLGGGHGGRLLAQQRRRERRRRRVCGRYASPRTCSTARRAPARPDVGDDEFGREDRPATTIKFPPPEHSARSLSVVEPERPDGTA